MVQPRCRSTSCDGTCKLQPAVFALANQATTPTVFAELVAALTVATANTHGGPGHRVDRNTILFRSPRRHVSGCNAAACTDFNLPPQGYGVYTIAIAPLADSVARCKCLSWPSCHIEARVPCTKHQVGQRFRHNGCHRRCRSSTKTHTHPMPPTRRNDG